MRPELDSRPRLEGARYPVHVPDKADHAYSAIAYPPVMHTLARIINQSPPFAG